MLTFPPTPSWDGLHPIIVHFPIGLLLTAPVLLVLAVLWKKHRFGLNVGAMAMMLLGTLAAFVAAATGDAAGELAERTPGVAAALERHEELGETTRNVFAALTGVFGVMLGAGWFLRAKLTMPIVAIATAVFLCAYGAGSLVLMNTGHEGGRLVHELGVRAVMGPASTPITLKGTAPSVPHRERGDD
jgi:uncharacterized membrane protein